MCKGARNIILIPSQLVCSYFLINTTCFVENQQIPGLELTPRSSTLKASTLSLLNGEPTNTNFKVFQYLPQARPTLPICLTVCVT